MVDGKKVDHPANGSKDVADVVAGAVYNCVVNRNNFMAWVGGSTRDKTPEQIKKEAEVSTVDQLVPYNYFKGRGQ